jgi:LPXTG-motif cell wall-anchored protein
MCTTDPSLLGATVAGGTLPFTGFDVIWFVIAGFALIMAAGAVWRIVPRRQA